MLLIDYIHSIKYPIIIDRNRYPSSKGIIDYLLKRGYLTIENETLLKELLPDFMLQPEIINLFLLYINDSNLCYRRISKPDITEFIISTFFKDGFNLLKKSDCQKFIAIANTFFPSSYNNLNQKKITLEIHRCRNLISKKVGLYFHYDAIITMINKNEIDTLLKELEEQLKDEKEIDGRRFYENCKTEFNREVITTPYFLFSLLKKNYQRNSILFYRTVYSIKYIERN